MIYWSGLVVRCDRLLEHQYAALSLVLLSDLFFVLMDVAVQNLETVYNVPSGEVSLIRFVSVPRSRTWS